MYDITNRKVNTAKNLAFAYGKAKWLFAAFVKRTKITFDYDVTWTDGLFAELIIAWMCGLFAVHNPDFDVKISVALDHQHKTDFLVNRRGKDGNIHQQKVQMKFNNDQAFRLPQDVKLVRLAPSPTFFGKFLSPMTGYEAFKAFLLSTDLYTAKELDSNKWLNSPNLQKAFNDAWSSIG